MKCDYTDLKQQFVQRDATIDTFKKQTNTKALALRKNFTGSKKICLQRAVNLTDWLHNRGLVV